MLQSQHTLHAFPFSVCQLCLLCWLLVFDMQSGQGQRESHPSSTANTLQRLQEDRSGSQAANAMLNYACCGVLRGDILHEI